jgi:hypothetical protein
MAIKHGKDGVVKVGAVTVAKTEKWSIGEEINVADASVQQADYEEHVVGQQKASGTVDCKLDDADTTGQGALTLGASVTLNLYPDGAGSGARYWSGTVTINSINTPSEKTAANMRTFSWTANGQFGWQTVT